MEVVEGLEGKRILCPATVCAHRLHLSLRSLGLGAGWHPCLPFGAPRKDHPVVGAEAAGTPGAVGSVFFAAEAAGAAGAAEAAGAAGRAGLVWLSLWLAFSAGPVLLAGCMQLPRLLVALLLLPALLPARLQC